METKYDPELALPPSLGNIEPVYCRDREVAQLITHRVNTYGVLLAALEELTVHLDFILGHEGNLKIYPRQEYQESTGQDDSNLPLTKTANMGLLLEQARAAIALARKEEWSRA